MNTNKETIIIDLDGTLYDSFCEDDKRIISALFKDNLIVKFLDKILWFINSFDFISNSTWILNFRLTLYALLNLDLPKKHKEQYKIRYRNLLRAKLFEYDNMLKRISNKYTIVVVTSNNFSLDVLKHYKYFQKVIYAKDNYARFITMKNTLNSFNVKFVIGNNYMDDISTAKKLDRQSIYIGDSKIKKCFKADYYLENFTKLYYFLKKN
jgi:FMN phosphatase YigB (HAD superfamily)